MKTLNHEVQVLINRWHREFGFSFSHEEREKIRVEKERILSLNEKLYKETGELQKATPKEVKRYKRNINKFKDLQNILIQDGASE